MSKFTATERMQLELGQSENTDTPEGKALRKIIDKMPWLLEVADCGYDPEVRNAAVVMEHYKCRFELAVKNYHDKKAEQNNEPQGKERMNDQKTN